MLPGVTGSFSTGVICGATAVAIGMSPLASMAISVFAYAGTAQLVVMQLAKVGATLIVISLAGLIVNMRYMMFSLSLSRYFKDLSRGRRFFFGVATGVCAGGACAAGCSGADAAGALTGSSLACWAVRAAMSATAASPARPAPIQASGDRRRCPRRSTRGA